MTTALVWFRRDLRLHANPAFAAATHHQRVVALYVLDPLLLGKAAPRRRHQLFAHLAALDAKLRESGGALLVRSAGPGKAVGEVVTEAALLTGATEVHYNADVTPYARPRDRNTTAALSVHGIDSVPHWGTLFHPPGSVLTQKGTVSQVFTPFWKRWSVTPLSVWPDEKETDLFDDPGDGLPAVDAVPMQPGGEDAALDRLHSWLDVVDAYPTDRNLPAIEGTSHLSADLRFGTLSPRHVADVVGEGTPGREAFVRQLAWRDWYAHLSYNTPEDRGLADASVRPAYDAVEWRSDPEDLAAWKAGRTGYPIVDAGMRQLNESGWMHNRVRMITASFLVKDLLIDWRLGERYFRHTLVDADYSQNAGNWQWVAGTGADAAPYFRIFNPVSQSRKFDPDGHYIRRWVPELTSLDSKSIHAPWEAGPLDLAAAGVILDDTYPAPIVDHADARERALAAYKAARS